jgi:hypothetical protein
MLKSRADGKRRTVMKSRKTNSKGQRSNRAVIANSDKAAEGYPPAQGCEDFTLAPNWATELAVLADSGRGAALSGVWSTANCLAQFGGERGVFATLGGERVQFRDHSACVNPYPCLISATKARPERNLHPAQHASLGLLDQEPPLALRPGRLRRPIAIQRAVSLAELSLRCPVVVVSFALLLQINFDIISSLGSRLLGEYLRVGRA